MANMMSNNIDYITMWDLGIPNMLEQTRFWGYGQAIQQCFKRKDRAKHIKHVCKGRNTYPLVN